MSPVALVTGSGAPRIGNIVVRDLASRGYAVVVHANRSLDKARQTVEELTTAGQVAIALAADVSQEGEVKQLFARTLAEFGRIDVLVNTSAIWEGKKLEETTADDVRRHFEINAIGTFLCCQQAGMQMVKQEGGGVIINVGDWAIARPYPDYAAYFPSKGAIPAMTRSFAVELAARNPRIRVNAILPGPVMLPENMTAEERERTINATLLRRAGQPENMASAVRFLIENDFITGVCLPVDGGRSVAGGAD
ncbi:MAG: SDR family oxidoreductase [Pirellulales bacterium]|nr:SDR family oxidoreductase [Pirellulales bacterium]